MARRLHENCRQEGRVDMLIGRKLKGFTRDEKRRDRRTPVALPMQVGSARATMTDISLGGFAFEADSGRVRPGAAFTATVPTSDERRVGTERVHQSRSRWSPDHKKK